MVNGDVLRQLFLSYSEGDDAAFRDAAEAIIREERSKNHRLLADDLQRLLVRIRPRHGERLATAAFEESELPRDRERGFPLVDVGRYDTPWERLIVRPVVMTTLRRIADEHLRADVLATAGLRATSRVLFYGPPGCGKSLAARVMASALDLPLFTVRFDAVVSSFLGETGANLRKVFDFISNAKAVVFFDEFDAIGKDRDNSLEHGELKRAVNSLLTLLDAYRGDGLLIAATNHEHLLDDAAWRRFDSVLEFARPTLQERVLLLRLYLRGFAHDANLALLARALNGATGADIERLATEAARRAVLDGRQTVLADDLEPGIAAFHERDRVGARGVTKRSGNARRNSSTSK